VSDLEESIISGKALASENSIERARAKQTMEVRVRNEPKVAVVLPTYCEVENIERLIQKLEELKLNLLIVVVDDSSPDGTAEKVRELQGKYDNIVLLLRPKKLGLGTAITTAFRFLLSSKSKTNYIITMDADCSHNPQDIPKLIDTAINGYDLVIGSRYCEGGRIIGWHRMRWLISRVANLTASLAIGARVRDCTSGLRCYSMRYVKNVLPNLHSQTYEIQIETVRQAHLQGFRFKEVPITFVNRKLGKSKLTRAEFQCFLCYVIKAKFGLTKTPFR
jgi:dolichol-phosphate mannosyltransferase